MVSLVADTPKHGASTADFSAMTNANALLDPVDGAPVATDPVNLSDADYDNRVTYKLQPMMPLLLALAS